MDNNIVTIKCFNHCLYELVYPRFFIEAGKPTLRKLFKWLFQYEWKNEKTIAFLDENIPEIGKAIGEINKEKIAKRQSDVNDRQYYYDREYKDPRQAATPEEKQRIKEQNAARKKRLDEAKSFLKSAEKQAQRDLQRATEVIAIYLEAKPY